MRREDRVSKGSFEDLLKLCVEKAERGFIAQAKSGFEQLLTQLPDEPRCLFSLGKIAMMEKDNDKAKTYFLRTLELVPDLIDSRILLGDVARAEDDFVQALKYYQEALKIMPNCTDALNNIANVYADMAKFDEAIQYYQLALDEKPDSALILSNLGNIYKRLGQYDKATSYFESAIAHDQYYVRSHYFLSSVRTYINEDPHIDQMMHLYQEPNLGDSQKVFLAFALGKAFDDCENYKEAFEYFKDGNKLHRKSLNYQTRNNTLVFDEIKRIFHPSFIKKYQFRSANDKTPIFILGMPRSGSTLVEQILGSHSQVYPAGEIRFIDTLAVGYLLKRRESVSTPNIEELQAYDLEFIRDQYLNSINNKSDDSPFVTDKLPLNFRWIGLIKMVLPEAKIIHCVRDKKDLCCSIYKSFFVNEGNGFIFKIDEIVAFYKLYQSLMRYWHKVLPGEIYDMSYEALVNNQVEESQKLLQFCDLPWEEACAEFYKLDRDIDTKSHFDVRKPIYQDAVGSWKNYEPYLNEMFAQLENS